MSLGWLAEKPSGNYFLPLPQAPSQAKACGVEHLCGVHNSTAQLSFHTLSRGPEQATHHSKLLIISCGKALDALSSSEPCGFVQLTCTFLAAQASSVCAAKVLPTCSTGRTMTGPVKAGRCKWLSVPGCAPAVSMALSKGSSSALYFQSSPSPGRESSLFENAINTKCTRRLFSGQETMLKNNNQRSR